MTKLKIILALLLMYPALVRAQQRIGDYTVYSRENGLGQNAYHDVVETSDGYWWISSNNGVFRFDGKRFIQYNALANNPNSPTDNNISDLAEDNNGNLWMAGFVNGITRYNLKTGKFKRYEKQNATTDEKFGGANCIFIDPQGTIWIGTTYRGLARYNARIDSFEFYLPNLPDKNGGGITGKNIVSEIVTDKHDENKLWVCCQDGLYVFDIKKKGFTKIFNSWPYESSNQYYQLLSMAQTDNEILLGTWYEGLLVYDKKSGSLKRIPYFMPGRTMYHYGILQLQNIGDSVVYMAAMNDGLLRYDIRTGKVKAEIIHSDVAHLCGEVNIQHVSYTPKAGFFAGGNNALYQLHPQHKRFAKQVEIKLEKYSPISHTDVTNFSYRQPLNQYWANFFNHNGLGFYDQHLNVVKFVRTRLNNCWLNDGAEDRDGKIWLVNDAKQLHFYASENKYIEPVTTLGSHVMNQIQDNIREMEATTKGNIWMAGEQALHFYNSSQKNILSLPFPLNAIKKKSSRGIAYLTLLCDQQERAWMVTNAGILMADPEKKNIQYYSDSTIAGEMLAALAIKSATIDNTDRLWLGYFNEGIQVLNTRTLKFEKSFGLESGLTSLEINYIAVDSNLNAIACLHSGLAIYKPNAGFWQIFTSADGLIRDYLDKPVFTLPDNRVVLNQIESFIVFKVDDILKNSDSVFTHITKLLINNKPVDEAYLPDYIGKLVLPSDANDIHIEFSATNWQWPFRTRYFYRVDGIHKSGEWFPAMDAMVNLTGISSGDYTFRFYAMTFDGNKTPERSMDILIKPPFYKTAWFILLCLGAIAFILYQIYRYRINQLKKLHEMRNTISRNLHDDIGATLSNINILNELAKRNATDKDKLARYLTQAGDDIQQVSETLSEIVWNINPTYDDLNHLLVRMKRYASDMLEGRDIAHILEFPESTNLRIPMDKRRQLFLVFKEAINNLVKYSGATEARIHLTSNSGQLILKINDNGKGFDVNKHQEGNGLKNMQQRAAQCGGKLEIQSAPGHGTQIKLEIPV